MAIKTERDDSVEIPTGVWLSDPETGEVIPDSGPVSRVPREEENAFGVMLMSAPVGKKDWPEVVKRCNEYQKALQSQIEQAEP